MKREQLEKLLEGYQEDRKKAIEGCDSEGISQAWGAIGAIWTVLEVFDADREKEVTKI